jgi:hypothetical protein
MSTLSFDAQRAVRRARKRLHRAEAELADRLARQVDRVPQRAVDEVMRSPAKQLVVAAIFSQMAGRVDRAKAAKIDATVRWRITDTPADENSGAVYDLVFAARGASVVHPPAPDSRPRLTITLPAAELLAVATGKSDPMQSYFKRRTALAGDIMLAAKMTTIFRMPKRRAG